MKIFIAHAFKDQDLVTEVTTALRNDEHEVVDPMALDLGQASLSEIPASIRSADLLIALLTDGNQNVFYELGLAAGANVPTLIAASAVGLIPVDLVSIPFVHLTGEARKDAHAIAQRANQIGGTTTNRPRSFQSAEAALSAAVQEPALLESMTSHELERTVMLFFEERGYTVHADASTRDSGVDFALLSPRGRVRVLVEVKKISTQGRVPVDAVSRVLAAVRSTPDAIGLLITSASYTAAAAAMAAQAGILLRTVADLVSAEPNEELTTADPLTAGDLFGPVAGVRRRLPYEKL